jgi:biopolymer transport protein ExbB
MPMTSGFFQWLTQADAVTLCVAWVLLTMSILSWGVLVFKLMAAWRHRRVLQALDCGPDAVPDAAEWQNLQRTAADDPCLRLHRQALRAVQDLRQMQQQAQGPKVNESDWLTRQLEAELDRSAMAWQRHLTVLASVGATAPFVGLLGTVWGIYHALTQIGLTGQASIEQVAGPVGESLIMTALGLAVAIPAVLSYNALVRLGKNNLSLWRLWAIGLHDRYLKGTLTDPGPAE